MKKQNVINYFGNTTKTAEFLNISPPAVSKWPEVIPEKQALRLERATNGALKFNQSLYSTVFTLLRVNTPSRSLKKAS